ncbi:hypothetical protein PSN45_000371 [Yamadazyma tenuis]|nr:hypothetical protein PSN45_000371 [Yamadazyma tenuis]
MDQKSFHKPPLSSQDTQNTFVSHTSNLSLENQVQSSSSSMSHIEEVSELSPPNRDASKNIFFIANSPSPPKTHDPQVPDFAVETSADPSSRPGELVRQDSLFQNHSHSHLHHYSSSDMSDDGIEEEDEYDEDSSDISDSDESIHDEVEPMPQEVQRSRKPSVNANASADDERLKSSRSSDSEWLSVTSEDDPEPALKPIDFNKRIPSSRQFSSDTITLGNTTSDPSPPMRPRSLLSGLFLNELAKQHEESVKLRRNQSMLNAWPENGGGLHTKPILKRSSTTGIITIGQSNNTPDSKIKISRPSILFQKRFTSATDVSKPYSSQLRTKLATTPEVTESSESILISRKESTPFEEGLVEEKLEEEDYKTLAKQTSIVGVSDFNVTSDNLQHPDSYFHPNSLSPNQSSVLSSSLTKYSLPRNQSFKNMLSKSSLNLTNLFTHKKYFKNNASNEKFKQSTTDSIPSIASVKSSSDITNSQELKLPQNKSSQNSHSSQDIKSSQEIVPLTPKPINSFNIEPEVEVPQETPERNSGEFKIKMSPGTTRKTMLDTELSKSLKDSISIDHHLGKVPLPQRTVITADGGFGDIHDDFSPDDYHSKGW